MGFADLHIHSVHSHDGTSSIPAILKYTADYTNLDVIAITDHDKVSGLREAQALGPKYGIEVIPGVEISTADGHLLALFITQLVPAGLPLAETIRRVGQLGGLCIAPHPEALGIGGLHSALISSVLQDPELARVLVGVEVFNAGLVYHRTNFVARALASTLDVAQVGSSDSHILSTIGDGATEFEGSTAADLRAALEQHATRPYAASASQLQGSIALGHWLPRFLLRKLGWIAWNAEPAAPLRYVRARQAIAVLAQE